jgi:hypothetical protein
VLIVGAFLVGLALRLRVIGGPAGVLNSDEAFMGLIAREARNGRYFWIFPGQSYEGTLESIPVALIQPLIGPSAELLKLTAAGFWLAAAALLESASRNLVQSRRGIVFSLVWLWSSSMMVLSTTALTGYGSGLAASALGYWAWSRSIRAEGDWRWAALAGLGFGVAVWQQPTFLPTALAFGVGALLVSTMCRLRPLTALAAGLALGIGPLVAFNAAHHWSGLRNPAQPEGFTYADRLRVMFTQLLPRFLGLRLRSGSWTFTPIGSVMLAAAVAMAYVWFARSSWTTTPGARPLVILVPFNVIAIAAFATSWYTIDARYAISFVAPLAVIGGACVSASVGHRSTAWNILAVGGIAAVFALVPLARERQLSRTGGDPNRDVAAITAAINAAGFHCALGDYWIAPRLDYLADGKVHASAESPYPIRLGQLYSDIANAPGRYVRVAPAGSLMDLQYSTDLAEVTRRVEVDGTAVFVPSNSDDRSADGFC